MRFRGNALPLAVVVGAGTAGACLAATATALLALAIGAGVPASGLVGGVAAGVVTSVCCGVVAATFADQFAARLRHLTKAAVSRIEAPGSPPLEAWTAGGVGGLELADLFRTVDAITLRAKVADDVAERHRRTAEHASAGMFEMLSGLVAAEEGARGQLAAELHDTVAQSLALARQQYALGTEDGIRKAEEYVDDAEEQVRAVMARTRPPGLREGDLASALAGLKAELDQRYGLTVHLAWPQEAHPLPLVTAVTIYRFFQEALLNVVKHADVEWAEASLSVDEESITASVSDAGPGFDLKLVRSDRGRHVGLGLLRERARLAGGSLEVSSMPAAGTVLQLRLPRSAQSARWSNRVAAPAPRTADHSS